MALPLGSTPGIIIGVGVGTAAAAAIEPLIEPARQDAWAAQPHKILDAGLLARLVAQGGVPLNDDTYTAAARDGFDTDKFDALVYLAQTTPAVGEALTLWRRKLISDDLFAHVLTKAGLDSRYYDGLTGLKTSEPLEPAEIAKAIHRNIMRGEGLLLVEPSSTPGKVPIVPQSTIDPETEAAESGMTAERLRIMVGNAGLPPGVVQGLQLLNRGAITEDDFSRLVGESNMRQEWGASLLALRRRLLTPHEYAELDLRGWIGDTERDAGAALSGMTADDAQLLNDMLGRPLAVHQITTGLARGGVYDDPHKPDTPGTLRAELVAKLEREGYTTTEAHAFMDAVQESNVRPQFYDLALANRYSYPSAFVLRTLAQAGELGDEAAVRKILLEIGWPPPFAAEVAAAWTGGAKAGDPHATKAETQLWNATHKSYVGEMATDTDAKERFALLGIPAAAQTAILALWDSERALIRKQLSPAQIRKAVDGKVPNPATGQPWTEAEAVQALKERGYDEADATVFLAE